MKLWIRSQNKCKLREAEYIYYYYEAGKHIIDCNGYPCGVYESKKRCLEIIDEIQKLLEMADSTKAFLNIECDGILDYNDVKGIIEFTRKHNAGYVPNGKVELIMPNVITYTMPEE